MGEYEAEPAALAAALARQLARVLQNGGGDLVDDVAAPAHDPHAAGFTIDTPVGRFYVQVSPSS